MMRTYSLRLRILFGILAAVALVWSVVGVIAYREARHEAEELLDAHLAQSATLLFAFLGDEADDIGERLPRHRYDKKVAFQVWDGERLLTRSPRAPDSRLSPREEGFSDVTIDGKAWRVFSVRDARRHYLIQVADAAESRAEISNEVASHLLQTMGVGLPVLGLVLGIFVLLAFRPLSRLADSIGAQAPQRLQPISLAEAPREVVPILECLNRLFEQVRRAQDDERRFTADAAHELRTPLAVLQTHAEVAQAAGDDATRQRALAHLVSGSRRAARLVDQLLTLARLDAQAELPDQEACPLRRLAVETVASLAPAGFDKGVELEVEEGPEISVTGSPLLLQVLLRNLLDNAIRHTPAGGRVLVCFQAQGDGGADAVLHVRDSGPGIPAEQRQEALARFRRLDPGAGDGHGLGLSIVTRIAELHGARLSLGAAADLGGLDVAIAFPGRARQPSPPLGD